MSARGKAVDRRTSADGKRVGINIFIHKKLLKALDKRCDDEDRSRRAELERILCRALGIPQSSL